MARKYKLNPLLGAKKIFSKRKVIARRGSVVEFRRLFHRDDCACVVCVVERIATHQAPCICPGCGRDARAGMTDMLASVEVMKERGVELAELVDGEFVITEGKKLIEHIAEKLNGTKEKMFREAGKFLE